MRIRGSAPRFDRRGHFKKAAIPGWAKKEVALRAGARPGETVPVPCHYCGALGSIWWMLNQNGTPSSHVVGRGLEFDHVVAEFNGGPSTPDNLVLACRPCNRGKGHR